VYSNFSTNPLPYRSDVRGDDVTNHGVARSAAATFTGFWRDDGTFSGGRSPSPGETVNVAYDIGGHRLA
jgi:hypothetical protein